MGELLDELGVCQGLGLVLATPLGAAYLFELVILVSPPLCKPFANRGVSTGLDRMAWRSVQGPVKRLVKAGLAGPAATSRYGLVCVQVPPRTQRSPSQVTPLGLHELSEGCLQGERRSNQVRAYQHKNVWVRKKSLLVSRQTRSYGWAEP